jgi:hypothetical protein
LDPQLFSAVLASAANQLKPDVNKLQVWDALCFFRLSPVFQPSTTASKAAARPVPGRRAPTAQSQQVNPSVGSKPLDMREMMTGVSMLAQDPLHPECKLRPAFYVADRDHDG